MVMMCIEIVQGMVTFTATINERVKECIQFIRFKFGSASTRVERKSEKLIAYNTQLIVSNLQMCVILLSVCLFGVSCGYL